VNAIVLIMGALFALISSVVLAYVVLVAMIGPWIAPTLVLMATLLFKLRRSKKSEHYFSQELAIIQSIGSVGGVVGMAMAFSFPLLFFLDPDLFSKWLASPLYFCSVISVTCLTAGGLGMYLGRLFSEQLVVREKLSFPISTLIHKMIISRSQGAQAKQMMTGLFSTGIFCFLRDGFLSFKGFLPKTIYFFERFAGKELAITLFTGPTLWAIGFLAGAVVVKPIIIGVLSKYFVLYPLNQHALYLPFSLFNPLSKESFSMAFCSGLVLVEAALNVAKYPALIWNSIKSYCNSDSIRRFFLSYLSKGIVPTTTTVPVPTSSQAPTKKLISRGIMYFEGGLVISASIALLTYFNFSLLSQVFMLVLTVIATYQMSYMSVKIGLLPFGRFSVFVMIPTMLIFSLNYVQLTILSVFVSVCGGVASDLLFDYKVGELCGIKFDRVHAYQWFGLVVTSLGMGFFLWLLFTTFQIGSPELFAQRGRTRALLIQATSFNFWALGLGGIFGLILKRFKINPALTLGGILMPNSISTGLIFGGLLSKVVDVEKYTPFWSGVFACESLWILIYMFVKLAGF
jgi:hypothetical protein